MLDRVDGLAHEIGAPAGTDAAWKLVASQLDGDAEREVPLRSYADARRLAVAVSELGLAATVLDEQERVRLQVWPPLE